jgi:hypothetical protein
MSPADTVVSRIVRELEKRTLGVREVFKVRTQAHQQKGMRKRTKLANGIEMLSAEAEDHEVGHTIQNYLTGLQTLLIAYSKAGSKLRADAPECEPKTMDSSMVVECPLDILMRYFYRVQDRAWRMPYPLALNWIWRHDEAERTVWVNRYRNSHETLGEVIKHCLITREAMWEIPLPVSRPPHPDADKVPGAAPKRRPQKPAGGGAGRPPKGAEAPNAGTLRDGSHLCRSFNAGNCQRKTCAYTHKCSKVLNGGRVCGGKHAAKDHR